MEGTVLSRGYPYCPFWRKVTISEFPRMTVHHEKWVESIANGLVGRVCLPWLFPWFSMVVSIVFSIVFPMVFHGCFHCFFSLFFPWFSMVFVDILWKTPKKYIQNIRKSSHRWPGHPSTKDLAAILGTTEVQEKSGEPTVAWDRETSTVDIAWGSKKIACFNGWWMMTCDEILWIVGCIRASLLPMRITRCRHSDSEENRIHWLWEKDFIHTVCLPNHTLQYIAMEHLPFI